MTPKQLARQKKFIAAFEEMHKQREPLHSKVCELGWKQRNALVSHVYSNYQKHEELQAANSLWDLTHRKLDVLDFFLELFTKQRDMYGYFLDPDYILEVITDFLKAAEKREKYELAEYIDIWRKKLV